MWYYNYYIAILILAIIFYLLSTKNTNVLLSIIIIIIIGYFYYTKIYQYDNLNKSNLKNQIKTHEKVIAANTLLPDIRRTLAIEGFNISKLLFDNESHNYTNDKFNIAFVETIKKLGINK
jgi:hypothetical protein